MIDVFLLGVLVAMGKLAQLAHAVPGIALWSLAGLVVLVAGIGACFDPLGTVGAHVTAAQLGLMNCLTCGLLSPPRPQASATPVRAAVRRCTGASPTA